MVSSLCLTLFEWYIQCRTHCHLVYCRTIRSRFCETQNDTEFYHVFHIFCVHSRRSIFTRCLLANLSVSSNFITKSVSLRSVVNLYLRKIPAIITFIEIIAYCRPEKRSNVVENGAVGMPYRLFSIEKRTNRCNSVDRRWMVENWMDRVPQSVPAKSDRDWNLRHRRPKYPCADAY